MLRLNSKGQEEAPFELLVSVIIMGFVLAVGFIAMNELTVKQCQGQVDNMMRQLKTDLEVVAKGQGKATFDFRMPSCYKKESTLKIRDVSEKLVCSRLCGGNKLDCSFLEFYGVSSGSNYTTSACLDIPPTAVFPKEGAAESGDEYCDPDQYRTPSSEFELVDWKAAPIPPGDYILTNEFSLMSDYPRICAYKRKAVGS